MFSDADSRKRSGSLFHRSGPTIPKAAAPIALFGTDCLISALSTLFNIAFLFPPLLITYHFGRFSVIFRTFCSTFVLLMCSFWILPFFVTPHIHLGILVSFTSSRASWPGLLIIQHSWSDHHFVHQTYERIQSHSLASDLRTKEYAVRRTG